MAHRGHMQKQLDTHPSSILVQEVVDQAATLDQIKRGFPALWVHLEECDECRGAFTELMGLAYERGRERKQAEESETQRSVILLAAGSILAILLLAGGALLWQQMGGDAAVNRIYEAMSPAVANIQVSSAGVTGSGVVFDERGYILTNYHVIREAESNQDLAIMLLGLGDIRSQLVGYDVPTDLAVLQVMDVPPSRLTVAEFGDSTSVEVGDLAIAIGNPFGLSRSLTVGHISAIGRKLMSNDPYAPDVDDVLQTDAAINPGNSGGPLFNREGKVIGINTRIESPLAGSVGVGFAISSRTALQIAGQIIERGHVRRPFLGIAGRPVDGELSQVLNLPVDYGLLIREIHPESPAAQMGLDAGFVNVDTQWGRFQKDADMILALNGQIVRTQDELNRQIARHQVGERIQMEVLQDGQRLTLDITLTERPWHLWAPEGRPTEGSVSRS